MAVIKRRYLDIYLDGKNRILSNTPITNFNDGGTAKTFLDILAVEGEDIYTNLDNLDNAFDPTKNVGAALDKIAFLAGVNRSNALTANDQTDTNFFFYIDTRISTSIVSLINTLYTYNEQLVLESLGYLTFDNNQILYFTLPEGILVNSNDTLTYTTTGPARFDASSNESYCGVIASATGPSYNVDANQLVKHNIFENNELRKIAQYIKCSNRYPIQNGSYSMNDAELRYNISINGQKNISNEIAIRQAALSIPGIRDIVIEKGRYGNGTVNIIIDGVNPLISDGLVNLVEDKVNLQASYGDTIFVQKPEYLGIELKINITLMPASVDPFTAKNTVVQNVIQYINDIPIGGELVFNRLISIGLSTEGIKDFHIDLFKVGEYDSFNKINRRQVVAREANQRALFNQRFYTDSGLVGCCLA